jgi:archaeosine synthase
MTPYEDPLELVLSPEVEATVQLIHDTWEPSPSKQILLILPCSAKKPYRTSPSQRRYLRVVDTVPGAKEAVEVVTLSGVFGIVPRQFEDLPAVLRYNLSLNRSKHTRRKHREIIEVLSTRVGAFLQKYKGHYLSILSYGRDRYVSVINRAVSEMALENVRVIGLQGMRLKSEGLEQLKGALVDALASLC